MSENVFKAVIRIFGETCLWEMLERAAYLKPDFSGCSNRVESDTFISEASKAIGILAARVKQLKGQLTNCKTDEDRSEVNREITLLEGIISAEICAIAKRHGAKGKPKLRNDGSVVVPQQECPRREPTDADRKAA